MRDVHTESDDVVIPNGSGAAAILAAGIGACTLAVLAIAADHLIGLRKSLIFYKPTGPLSGVTTSAVFVWLAIWAVLHFRWRNRNLPVGAICTAALVLLGLTLVLTFPPIGDLF